MAVDLTALRGYDVVAPLGESAHSIVYRAVSHEVGAEVALKVGKQALTDESSIEALRQGYVTALRFHDRRDIVTVFDASVLDDGRPYVAMELLVGGAVTDSLSMSGPLAASDAARLVAAAAAAVEVLHDSGVVHGAVAPTNVLLDAARRTVLSEVGFGLTMQRRRVLPGPVWLAPEVAEGAPPSPAADVYGLASVLYTTLTGSAPFDWGQRESELAFLLRLARDAPPSPLGDVPQALRRILEDGLAKRPEDRIPSVRSLIDLLAAFEPAIHSSAVSMAGPPAAHTVSLSQRSPKSKARVVEPLPRVATGAKGGRASDSRRRPGRRKRRGSPPSTVFMAFAAGVIVGIIGMMMATAKAPTDVNPPTATISPTSTSILQPIEPIELVEPLEPVDNSTSE